MLRRNSVQGLFNGYYYDYQLAALSQNQAFINTQEILFAQKGGKVPQPGPMPFSKSELSTPKNQAEVSEEVSKIQASSHAHLSGLGTSGVSVGGGVAGSVYSRKVHGSLANGNP